MAAGSIPGPLPKADHVRENDKTLGIRVIYPDDVVRGPELPDDIGWCSKTRAWYEGWRRSPMAQLMNDQDWDTVLVAAVLHNRIWCDWRILKPSEVATMSKEIDRKMSNLGATFGDRLRLRVAISTDPKPGTREAKALTEAEVDFYASMFKDS